MGNKIDRSKLRNSKMPPKGRDFEGEKNPFQNELLKNLPLQKNKKTVGFMEKESKWQECSCDKPLWEESKNPGEHLIYIEFDTFVSIPLKIVDNFHKADRKNTLFFKLGGNNIYCEDLYILKSYDSSTGVSNWFLCEDPIQTVNRKFNFPKELINFLTTKKVKAAHNIGNFMMERNKWGFMLNLQACDEIYDGKIGNNLKILLNTTFFQNLFRKYAFYVIDQDKEDRINLEIKNTDDDPPIDPSLVPFNDRLFLHQKKEVGFMYSRELDPFMTVMTDLSFIPLLDSGFYFRLDNYTRILTKNELKSTKVNISGGIIASEVGSGKTASVIGLISIENEGRMDISLVIVTKNILYQWKEEFAKFCPRLQVYLLEDDQNFLIGDFQAVNPQVVLTFREIIEENRFPKFLRQITYSRVILDEFHEIIGEKKSSEKSKKSEFKVNEEKFISGLSKISRKFTWGVTGTPNDLDFFNEISVIAKALNLNEDIWKINNYEKILIKFIKTSMRRNLKGAQALLPNLKKSERFVNFSCVQNLLYQGSWKYGINDEKSRQICNDIMEQFDFSSVYPGQKIEKVINQISALMDQEFDKLKNQLNSDPKNKTLMSRLQNLEEENNFYSQTIETLRKKSYECPICQIDQIPESQIILCGCFHWLCFECYQSLRKHFVQAGCPICRNHIQDNELLLHPRFFQNMETKLDAIIQEIGKVPQNEKIIIFTQYHNLILKLCGMFEKAKINHIVLKGVPKKINIRLQKFKTMLEIRVILMSVEQAASGINLQEANHVFFAHPIFGLSNEKTQELYRQCIGRSYRIGQTRTVHCKIFVTKNTIEESYMGMFFK